MLDLANKVKLLDRKMDEHIQAAPVAGPCCAAARFSGGGGGADATADVHADAGAAAADARPLSALEDLLMVIQRKSAAFEAEMDAAAQWQPCALHPQSPPALLNRAASMGAGRLVYTCHTCEGQAREARFQRRIAAAGIPADVRHATLTNFETTRPGVKSGEGLATPLRFLEKAGRFAAGEVRHLILAGSPGIGKGHLAAALAIQHIRAGKSVMWIEAARLFAEVHKAYTSDKADEVTLRYAERSLLVLDEVALRDLPSDGEEILFAIFNHRHKQGLPSILLSNQPAGPVKKWLGSRITDRLRSGGVVFCYGEWESMRGGGGDGAEW